VTISKEFRTQVHVRLLEKIVGVQFQQVPQHGL
jgi:hypothetical protein